MSNVLSIADFRKTLPGAIQRAEAGEAIQISRHGVPVAVVISLAEYEQLRSLKQPIADVLAAWRHKAEAAGMWDEKDDPFVDVRDRSERPLPDLG